MELSINSSQPKIYVPYQFKNKTSVINPTPIVPERTINHLPTIKNAFQQELVKSGIKITPVNSQIVQNVQTSVPYQPNKTTYIQNYVTPGSYNPPPFKPTSSNTYMPSNTQQNQYIPSYPINPNSNQYGPTTHQRDIKPNGLIPLIIPQQIPNPEASKYQPIIKPNSNTNSNSNQNSNTNQNSNNNINPVSNSSDKNPSNNLPPLYQFQKLPYERISGNQISQIKNKIWSILQTNPAYSKYINSSTKLIPYNKIRYYINDIFREHFFIYNFDINIIIKNTYILQSFSGNGVHIEDLINFILKRVCGELILIQLKPTISKFEELKILKNQFRKIINLAFRFLNISIYDELSDYIFDLVDSKRVGFITFAQYFQAILNCFSRNRPNIVPQQDSLDLKRPKKSKIRTEIWNRLRFIYTNFIQGKSIHSFTYSHIYKLLVSFLGQQYSSLINFILPRFLRIDWNSGKLFETLATLYIRILAKSKWNQWMKMNSHSLDYRQLNVHQFITLFQKTFGHLLVKKFKRDFLVCLFRRIDRNKSGKISYNEYMCWIYQFISVTQYYGEIYWCQQDDFSNPYDPFHDYNPPHPEPDRNFIISYIIPFKFTDRSLANQVYTNTLRIFSGFDYNHNKIYSKRQIWTALTTVLKQDQQQYEYVRANSFLYDKNQDGIVTEEQFITFLVQKHLGLMSIQRMHKRKAYSNGQRKIMNFAQFYGTLTIALRPVQVKPSENITKKIFNQIDLDGNGWIKYSTYFQFLKYYFGQYKRYEGNNICPVDPEKDFYDKYKNCSAIDRFIQIILDQLLQMCKKYDTNRNGVYDEDEIRNLLHGVFKLSDLQTFNISLLVFKKSLCRPSRQLNFLEMISIILQSYFLQIILKRRSPNCNYDFRRQDFNVQVFTQMIMQGCSILKYKPLKQDIKQLFNQLDTNRNGRISFFTYMEFISKCFGNHFRPDPIPLYNPKQTTEQQMQMFHQLIQSLRQSFDLYDYGKKSYLTPQQLRMFIRHHLKSFTLSDQDTIFLYLNRNGGTSQENKFNFKQFVHTILLSTNEINLKKYNSWDSKSGSLTKQAFDELLEDCHSPILKKTDSINKVSDVVFSRKSKNGRINYTDYVNWITGLVENN